MKKIFTSILLLSLFFMAKAVSPVISDLKPTARYVNGMITFNLDQPATVYLVPEGTSGNYADVALLAEALETGASEVWVNTQTVIDYVTEVTTLDLVAVNAGSEASAPVKVKLYPTSFDGNASGVLYLNNPVVNNDFETDLVAYSHTQNKTSMYNFTGEEGISGLAFNTSANATYALETTDAHSGNNSVTIDIPGTTGDDVKLKFDHIFLAGKGNYQLSFYAKVNQYDAKSKIMVTSNLRSSDLPGVDLLPANNKLAKFTSTNDTWMNQNGGLNSMWKKYVLTIDASFFDEAYNHASMQPEYAVDGFRLELAFGDAYNAAFAGKYFIDKVELLKTSTEVFTTYDQSFASGELPMEFSMIDVAGATVENEALKVTMHDVDGILPGEDGYINNPGWGQTLEFDMQHRPELQDNFVLKFKVKIPSITQLCNYVDETGNSWGNKVYTRYEQSDNNKGKFGMKVCLYSNQNINNGNELAGVMITVDANGREGEWIPVQADLSSAFNQLGAGDYAKRINITVGTTGRNIYGDLFFDDFKFGYPPMVAITNWPDNGSAMKTCAGWDIKVNPNRGCDVYIVPQGTGMNITALEDAVNGGLGIKRAVAGKVDNVISTDGLGGAGIEQYLVVAYINEDDYSDGYPLSIYPARNNKYYEVKSVNELGMINPADGSANDAGWANAQAASISVVEEGASLSYDPLKYSAEFKAAYDQDGLYLLIKVKEDLSNVMVFNPDLADLANSKPWQSDAFEVTFKGGGSDPDSYIKSVFGYGQPMTNQRPDQVLNSMFYVNQDPNDLSGTTVEYFYEVFYEWNGSLGFTNGVNSGDAIPAEIAVFDVNQAYPTVKDHKLYWNGPEFQNVNDINSIVWGNLYIDQNPTPTNIQNNEYGSEFTVYPNPARDIINISCADEIDAIAIYTISGRIVKRTEVGSKDFQMNISGLNQGNYIVAVETTQGLSYKQIVKF